MEWYHWTALVALILALATFGISYYCYRRVFYSAPRKPRGENEFPIPDGAEYLPYREAIVDWIKTARSLPHECFSIRSHDGLTLHGKYYECKKGAPVELLLHGYRGDGERDVSAGIERCFALDRNVLIIDQRASGASDGHTITFGAVERYDCLRWVAFLIERFGEEVEIILSGVSMGAATVLLAAGETLPKQVKCVLADCGFTSAQEMIKLVITKMHLPAKLTYPFVRLGGRLFGGFDINESAPEKALVRCKVPVIFLHGGNDNFVPCQMSRRMYELCPTAKSLCIIEDADHGLAFPADKEGYLKAVKDFEKEWKN